MSFDKRMIRAYFYARRVIKANPVNSWKWAMSVDLQGFTYPRCKFYSEE